ncbi:uncharacterized protein [Dermacentor albipictus]|uniref:uncharacterized protein isoform X2 n=1 Tax=Dermacentor albipictus TaxID=60249 RepID=UPI0038FD0492
MWLTTQMHREEELAAMQYPAGNWSSSCNKIAGTCGTSQWPFECLAEGERCFCFAFPRESIATSIILHGGIDEGTAEEGDKGAVSSSFYLGGSYQIHGGGVIASLGNHCTEFDELQCVSRAKFTRPSTLQLRCNSAHGATTHHSACSRGGSVTGLRSPPNPVIVVPQ